MSFKNIFTPSVWGYGWSLSHIEIILSFKLGQIRTDQDIPGGTRTDQSYLAYLEIPGVRTVSKFSQCFIVEFLLFFKLKHEKKISPWPVKLFSLWKCVLSQFSWWNDEESSFFIEDVLFDQNCWIFKIYIYHCTCVILYFKLLWSWLKQLLYMGQRNYISINKIKQLDVNCKK